MNYIGSKRKIAKELLPIITENRAEEQYYIEPFAGGMGMIEQVTGKRIANDINSDLIYLYQSLLNGWIPPDYISKEKYQHVKDNREIYPRELVTFVGYSCSFGGAYFGSYAQNKRGDNYCRQGKNGLLKQLPKLQGVEFSSLDYRELIYPNNSIIYCDPPYQYTIGYGIDFDHEQFWDWCRDMSSKHTLYISEYTAPPDFTEVWSKEVVTNFSKNGRAKRIEKLFRYY
ncbi:MAG: DNA adenine methylase [Flavobacterium sp.]|nr:MAG: DNA adenine methylase [Flavobacterium sp.]